MSLSTRDDSTSALSVPTSGRESFHVSEEPGMIPMAGSKMKFSIMPSKFRESGLKAPSSKTPDSIPANQGKVIQRNYILNDVEAIKKKIRSERRGKDLSVKEAKDGSNIMIALKASLFEIIKSNFIRDLQEDPNVISRKNAEGLKVSTLESGAA